MEFHYDAWRKAMLHYGIDLAPDDYYPLEGTNVYELAKKLFGLHNLNGCNEKELVNNKEEYYLNNHKFVLYPGVVELLNVIKLNNIKLGLVTASLRKTLNNTAPLKFLKIFDVIITGQDTSEGKPSPKPYLKAAKKLGVMPEDCVAVENSPIGIASAKKAKIYCVAICNTLDSSSLQEADEIIYSFNELLKKIRKT
jgi:HAD superfamily hydrolase (TIGR01509 family)|tara:strand:- start:264 stop:851 length:588 start_codon:yes stop_codon:yes gene_type:complete